jgi:hypothetical protein
MIQTMRRNGTFIGKEKPKRKRKKNIEVKEL